MYCSGCTIGRLDPIPSSEILNQLYGSRDYFIGSDRVGYADYDQAAEVFQRTFKNKLDLLLRGGPVDSLLEIGCGPGFFLDVARRAGIQRTAGLDPNPWAVEFARSKGLDVRLGSVGDLPENEQFDAAVMLDVLEHVAEPIPFLTSLAGHLQPGGRLLIMTPNITSWLARISGSRWVSFKIPEHIYYYSPHSLCALLPRCGLEVVQTRASHQYVTIDFFLDRLARIARPLATLLQRLSNRFGLGERVVLISNGSIEIVARRR